jgi:Uma2 family endonuclease
MVANSQSNYMLPHEYLEWEEHQELKHEYIDGEVFAMTGGTIPHSLIAVNITGILKNHLRDSSCRTYSSDAKVAVSEKGPFYYPDVTVSCDERDKQAIKFIQHPCLIIEILSPSTEVYDRGEKFKSYRQIKTLKEYVLINADKINVECFRLNDRGFWELHTYEEWEELELTTANISIPMSIIYEDVVFPSSEN